MSDVFNNKEKMKRKIIILCMIVILLLGISTGGYYYVKKMQSKTSPRQAVFMANGAVYFGQIENTSGDFVTINKVFYLKSSDATSSNSNTQISLIKLGNEVYGPEDVLYLNKQQILYYETMRSDSKINSAIDQYLAGKKS